MNDTYESILEAVFAEDSGPKRKSKARAKGKTLQKTQSEILKAMLALETDDDEQKKTLESLGVEPNYAGQINLNVVRQAAGGIAQRLPLAQGRQGGGADHAVHLPRMSDRLAWI